MPSPGEDQFWELAEPLLLTSGVTRSTMMGFPCLRVGGAFFACCDRSTGDLVVKVSAERVDELAASGRGLEFAPAGKRFREWVAIPYEKRRTWQGHLDAALVFVTDGAGVTPAAVDDRCVRGAERRVPSAGAPRSARGSGSP